MANRYRIPLRTIKIVCRLAVVPAIFYVVMGNWVVSLCLIMGALVLEKNLYRCPHCRHRLDMRISLTRYSACPWCRDLLL